MLIVRKFLKICLTNKRQLSEQNQTNDYLISKKPDDALIVPLKSTIKQI